MKWLEIIELRAVGTNRKLLESQLQELMDEAAKESLPESVRAYRRAMIDSDLSIHLIHESADIGTNGSSLGLRLVSGLKEFGLINHSIWIEMRGK